MLSYGADPMLKDYLGKSSTSSCFVFDHSLTLGWSTALEIFSAADFNTVFHQLSHYKEFAQLEINTRTLLVGTYTRKLLWLLDSAVNITCYITNHLPRESTQPIHDLCLFMLPKQEIMIGWFGPNWLKIWYGVNT